MKAWVSVLLLILRLFTYLILCLDLVVFVYLNPWIMRYSGLLCTSLLSFPWFSGVYESVIFVDTAINERASGYGVPFSIYDILTSHSQLLRDIIVVIL